MFDHLAYFHRLVVGDHFKEVHAFFQLCQAERGDIPADRFGHDQFTYGIRYLQCCIRRSNIRRHGNAHIVACRVRIDADLSCMGDLLDTHTGRYVLYDRSGGCSAGIGSRYGIGRRLAWCYGHACRR